VYNLETFINSYSTYKDFAEVKVHSDVFYKNKTYPLASIHYGNPDGPTLLVAGGVHGLERIGAQLSLSLLDSFHQRLAWDETLQEMLKKIQIVFMPLINPVGYFESTRSNANGVDLMRNAPIEASDATNFLLGGHHYSNKLPWFRGHELQIETKFVIDTVQEILTRSNTLISLDMHSGFGFKDQLWFPFANSKKTFPQISEMYLFFELFEKTHPYHIYKIEPQSKNYLTHGDIWDYCYLNLKKENQVYLPLTLEMGSWIWVKKNPWQLFSKTGLYNPIKTHRINRTLRRHRPLFDFMLHSLASNHVWTNQELSKSEIVKSKALEQFYETK
jgi:hypothetical protein